jgi:hypothetical protein
MLNLKMTSEAVLYSLVQFRGPYDVAIHDVIISRKGKKSNL